MIAQDNCCDFDIQFIERLQEPPPESQLDACLLNSVCDKRYVFAGKIINAYQQDDLSAMHQYFAEALPHITAYPPEDELSLKLVFLYADYLKTIGENISVDAYYSYIIANSKNDTALHLLAKIGYQGTHANNETLDLLTQEVTEQIYFSKSINIDQKISIIIKLGRQMPRGKLINFYLNNYHFYKGLKNDRLKGLFLTLSEFNISQGDTSTSKFVLREIRSANRNYAHLDETNVLQNLLADRALSNQNYQAYYDLAKKAVEAKFGPLESTAQLVEIIENATTVPAIEIMQFANSNLYLTRLGKGIDPVIDALSIYEAFYTMSLKYNLQYVNAILSKVKTVNTEDKFTTLVIGTYLYQKTNDLSYLNRSISLLDGFSSGGSQYWTLARQRMRRDEDFARAIEQEQALAEALKYITPQTSLPEIFRQQQALVNHRDNMQEVFQDFFEEVTNSYLLDLKEVQEDLATDTTGLVAFYQNENLLYRLFLSPDTVDIARFTYKLGEVLALNEELTATIPEGKSAAQTKAASRQLYQLLFAGLDSLLPDKMHVITNGELESVPFAALRRDTADGSARYLGVECAISRQFSIRAMQLLEDMELSPKYAQPLAMAPSFSNEFLQASALRQAGFKLPPLVFNTEEVRNLEGRTAGQYYYDATATINHYVQDASDYGVIHLATHAISSETDGLRSHLYLLDDEGVPAQLYASDIGDQTLNADLVVLSACETDGGSSHSYEGKIGLTKAYIAAGARSVVSSNWAVDDHATAELMQTFYEQLEQGRSPHEALQHARKAYLERHPDAAPYKWAAFEAHGGMQPVSWKQRASWWPALGYGAAGIFVLLLVGRRLRRKD